MERTAYEYIKNKPAWVYANILQTDAIDDERISSNDVNSLFKDTEIITIKDYFRKFRFLDKSIFTFALKESVFVPFIGFFMRHFIYRHLYESLGRPDVVYCFNDDRAPLLFRRKEMLLVGSEHGWHFLPANLPKKVQVKLVLVGLLFRKIDVYHVFPRTTAVIAKSPLKYLELPSGVCTDIFYQKTQTREITNILFFGSLQDCKGVNVILETWKLYLENNTNLNFHIAGKGKLESVVKEAQGPRFIYHEFVSEDDLPTLIRSCDILVYPSLCDSFSLVVAESLSCGLTVLTNSEIASNFQDFVSLGQVKIIENSPVSIYSQVMRLLTNCDDWDRKKSEELCKQKLDWKFVTDKLYEELEKLNSEMSAIGDLTYVR
ncbi:MAG: glycosyltransferase family 4 protein [Thermoplasmataceae archaeon]|jgi:glycosyltransferase involved in cell wall biosynthesis